MKLNEEKIVTLYKKEKKSTVEIAKEFDTNPTRVNRILKRNGVKLRTKSQSQKLNLKKNGHPCEGKAVSEETKVKISKSVSESFDDERREKYSQRMIKRWEKMPVKQKEKLIEGMREGIRKASQNGSKIEHFFVAKLRENHYNINVHEKYTLSSSSNELELDIVIPDLKIAIEIDGPSHTYPIWGEDKLEKTLKYDARKNGLLTKSGYKVIRVNYTHRRCTKYIMEDVFNQLLEVIKKIENNKRTKNVTGIFFEK